jgi:surface carbohydrate biosynthesis protein
MIVYFHIDEITRDLITVAALKKKLDNHPNIKLFFGNRTLNNIISRFKLYKLFDLFIIPNVDFIKDIFKNPENIKEKKILILYSECTGSILNDKKRSSYHFFGSDFGKTGRKKWLRAINYFLLWGDHSLKICKKIIPSLKKYFYIVGYPRADSLCHKKKNNINKKFTIGFVSRLDTLNIFDSRSNIDLVYNGLKSVNPYMWSPKDYSLDIEDTYYNYVSDLRIFFEIILQLNNNNKYKLYLRTHPRENKDNWVKLIKKYKLNIDLTMSEAPFAHWLSDKDLVISPPSTTFYDCFVNNTKIISIENINRLRRKHVLQVSDDNNPINNFVQKPNSIKSLLRIINNVKHKKLKKNINLNKKELKELLLKDINYPYSLNSIKEIVNIILKFKINFKKSSELKYFIINQIFKIILIFYKTYRFLTLKKTSENSSFFIIDRSLKKRISNLI